MFVHRAVFDDFVSAFKEGMTELTMGDPLDDTVDLSCMVSEPAAETVQSLIDQAVSQGAEVLVGHEREGALFYPTLLTGTDSQIAVNRQELFAPVVVVEAFDENRDVLNQVNDSPYGLQVGVFTRDIQRMYQSFHGLDVGAVMVNQVSSWRIDHMPYGGDKRSGNTREGVRYAVEAMTVPKTMVVHDLLSQL